MPHEDGDDEETKKEVNGKRVVIDKATGKAKEVDIYDRDEPKKKAKDPEKMKAIFSSNLEQSIVPAGISTPLLYIFNCMLCIEINTEAPDEEFEVEYVYGYRTFDCRQNLYLSLFLSLILFFI